MNLGVCMEAGNGLLINGIPASSGVLSFLRELHFRQAATRLDHELLPPLDFGITCSNSKSAPLEPFPQYMHL